MPKSLEINPSQPEPPVNSLHPRGVSRRLILSAGVGIGGRVGLAAIGVGIGDLTLPDIASADSPTAASEAIANPDPLTSFPPVTHSFTVMFPEMNPGLETPPVSYTELQRLAKEVSDFYAEQSYGKYKLDLMVMPWIKADQTINPNDLGQMQSIAENSVPVFQAVNLLPGDPKAKFNRMYLTYAGNNTLKGEWGGTIPDVNYMRSWVYFVHKASLTSSKDRNGETFTWDHELGHQLKLGHADSLSIGNTIPTSWKNVQAFEVSDDTDVMGLRSGDFNGWERFTLGWIDSKQVTTITQPGTYPLDSLETQDGIKLLRVANLPANPFGTDLILELRDPSQIKGPEPDKNYPVGVRAHIVKQKLGEPTYEIAQGIFQQGKQGDGQEISIPSMGLHLRQISHKSGQIVFQATYDNSLQNGIKISSNSNGFWRQFLQSYDWG